MNGINAKLLSYLHPIMVYHVMKFGEDPDPDPDLRVKKRFENPPSLRSIPDLIFGIINLKIVVRPLQTFLFNISSGFCYAIFGSNVLTPDPDPFLPLRLMGKISFVHKEISS